MDLDSITHQESVERDNATDRVMCFNPMEINLPEGGPQVVIFGACYLDKYVLTDNGWRIKERLEEKSWAFNLPEFLKST